MAVRETRSIPEDVVGRESELERIAGFFEGDWLALWLEGAAGIGKTTLWRATVELARDRGYRVLASQPTAAETAFSFAALGDLLTQDVEKLLPELPEPQRRALEVALALTSPEHAALGEHVVGLAFLSTLQHLAAQQPVLVAIDDIQWLDRPSATVLQFAARRVTHENLKVLLTARVDEEARPLQLERDLAERLLRIEVGPLSLGALHRLVLSRLGKPLSRPTLRKVDAARAETPSTRWRSRAFFSSTDRPSAPPSRCHYHARSKSWYGHGSRVRRRTSSAFSRPPR